MKVYIARLLYKYLLLYRCYYLKLLKLVQKEANSNSLRVKLAAIIRIYYEHAKSVLEKDPIANSFLGDIPTPVSKQLDWEVIQQASLYRKKIK